MKNRRTPQNTGLRRATELGFEDQKPPKAEQMKMRKKKANFSLGIIPFYAWSRK